MASPCELRLYATSQGFADRAAEAAIAEVDRIEQKYSRYRHTSVLSAINRAAGGDAVTIDSETSALLQYADSAYQQSDGLFDISSGVLRRAWNFKSGQLPSEREVANLVAVLGWPKVELTAGKVRLSQVGMELDFGGFAKEYAVDAAARVCAEQGIAHGLVDLGGDIRVLGPHPDGSAWQIGIRDPQQPTQAKLVVPLKSGGLASSGDYERFMVIAGKRYSHILDPRSGWPVENTFRSLSVVAPLCLLAGTAATVGLLKGVIAAPAWLDELGLPHCWVQANGQTGGDLGPWQS
nr:FAD:protein FMN transferase [Zhongshania antarctica]